MRNILFDILFCVSLSHTFVATKHIIMTAIIYAEQAGISVDRIRQVLRENFPDEIFSRHAPLREDQIAALRGGITRTKKRSNQETKQPAEKPTPSPRLTVRTITEKRPAFSFAKIRSSIFDFLIAGIVIGHAGLIWYDCSVLWSTPGIIGGGMAFMIVLATVLVSTDTGKYATAQAGLYTVLLIDAGAWFVHYPTFSRFATIGEIETGVLCGFICLFSFLSLVIFQTSRSE